VTDTAIELPRDEAGLPEQQEDAVVAALLSGRSLRSIRKEFNLTLDEVDAIIARTWPVDQRARVRMVMTDLGKLDRLITEFFRRSLVSTDAASAAALATVAIRAFECKHALTGMSAATRLELTIMPREAPTQFEQIKRAIFAVAREGNGEGKTGPDALSPPDDAEQSH
jgi:hypothetical protein